MDEIDKTYLSDLIKALNIFLKYGDVDYPVSTDHDILYIHVAPGIVSEDDKAELDKLGFIADESGSFCSYRWA